MEKDNTKLTEVSDWIAYHKSLVDDIQYAKNQQWRLTYYIVLLLGAIFGLSKVFEAHYEVSIVLSIITFLLGFFGTCFLIKFQKDLKRYRKNIGKVRKEFPTDLREVARFKPAEGNPTYYVSFLSLLIGVIWLSVVFIGLAINYEHIFPKTNNLIVDQDWHRYEGRSFKIIGDNREFIQVLSDGWKIIGKTSKENEYEWAWEVEIKAFEHPENKPKFLKDGRELVWLCTIDRIEYTLFDEDGFELAKDVIRTKSLPWDSTKIFRSTNTISKNKAIRSASSSYRIILVSKPWQ